MHSPFSLRYASYHRWYTCLIKVCCKFEAEFLVIADNLFIKRINNMYRLSFSRKLKIGCCGYLGCCAL